MATRIVVHGTHQAELMGFPATGNEMPIGATNMIRVDQGKIAEHWVNSDGLGMMMQLGAIPPPGQWGRGRTGDHTAVPAPPHSPLASGCRSVMSVQNRWLRTRTRPARRTARQAGGHARHHLVEIEGFSQDPGGEVVDAVRLACQ